MKTWDISNFNLNTTLTNYTMVDGLTPEKIKYKYIWLLNALVENAIVGEDEYGLVWYAGTWYGGEWEDGTWYSGIWHDGEWKNGKFYSYRFDLPQLLIRNRRILEKDNPVYSQFLHGIWRRGEFYNGYFGPEGFYDNWDSKSKIERFFHDTRWEGGVFYNGIFRNSTWWTGKFQGGIFYNSEWFDQFPGNSIFSNGTFQGNTWWSGNFTGGDFVLGDWLDGNFNQANPNIRSRFGSMPITGVTTKAGVSVVWHNGTFINGEFHSGLNLISGFTNVSDNHNRTHWLDGTWYNGTWYGGTHESGNFNNGYWFEGYWSGGTFNNGYWINGFWEDGIINDGFFIQGLFKTAEVYGGQLGYQSDYLQTRADTSLTFPPKFLGALSTVITTGSTNITETTATSGGEVLYDGGEIVTRRGVCWSDSEYPNITTNYKGFTIDGNGVGGFVSYLTGLINNTTYYIRAYATNALGTSYGNQVEFSTFTPPPTTTTTTTICYTGLGRCPIIGSPVGYQTTGFTFGSISLNQRFVDSGGTYYKYFNSQQSTPYPYDYITVSKISGQFGCPPTTTTTTSIAPTTTTTTLAPTTTTTSLAPTTTTTTTPAFKIWNFSLLLYTSYLCWNTADFTGTNEIYTAYSANPLTITKFYSDTALTIQYTPGNLDTIGYVEAPSTIIVYTATITGIGDVSNNVACISPTTTTTTT